MNCLFKFESLIFTKPIALTHMLLYLLVNMKNKVYKSNLWFYFLCCRNFRSSDMKYLVSIDEQLGIHHRIATFRCALQSLKLLWGLSPIPFYFWKWIICNVPNGAFMLTFGWIGYKLKPLYTECIVNRVILTLLEVHQHWQRQRLSRCCILLFIPCSHSVSLSPSPLPPPPLKIKTVEVSCNFNY